MGVAKNKEISIQFRHFFIHIVRTGIVAAALFAWTSSVRATCAVLQPPKGWVSQILSCEDVRPAIDEKVQKVPADYVDRDHLYRDKGTLLVVIVYKTRPYETVATDFLDGITNEPIKWTGPWYLNDDPSGHLRTVFWRGGKCGETHEPINFLFDQPCCDTLPIASASCLLEIPTVTTLKQLEDYLKSTIPKKRFNPPPPIDIPDD